MMKFKKFDAMCIYVRMCVVAIIRRHPGVFGRAHEFDLSGVVKESAARWYNIVSRVYRLRRVYSVGLWTTAHFRALSRIWRFVLLIADFFIFIWFCQGPI